MCGPIPNVMMKNSFVARSIYFAHRPTDNLILIGYVGIVEYMVYFLPFSQYSLFLHVNKMFHKLQLFQSDIVGV